MTMCDINKLREALVARGFTVKAAENEVDDVARELMPGCEARFAELRQAFSQNVALQKVGEEYVFSQPPSWPQRLWQLAIRLRRNLASGEVHGG